MANNDIKIKVSVDSKGMGQLERDAKNAAGSVDNLNKSKNRFNKREKGAAGITSNGTKAFAKQAQTLGGGGGLVAAYATLAANVFAVTAAFGVLQRAAGIQQLAAGLEFTGRAAGQNLPLVVDKLRSITDGALAASDAMNAVALGVSAGFDESQLQGLTRVAKGASLALGRDMTDAMTRLVRGSAKLEPEILDELGIMVRLDTTTREYAASLGKTSEELTQFERRMAFTNAVIDQGQKKFGALSHVVDANPYDRLAASFEGMSKTVLNFLNTALKPIANFLADNIVIVAGVFAGLAGQTINALIPSLTGAGNVMAELATKSAALAKSNLANVGSFEGAPAIFKKYQKSVQAGTASEKDMQKTKTSLIRSIKMHNIQMDSFTKKHGKGSDAVKDKTNKLNGAKNALKALTVAETEATVATTLNTRANLLNAAAHGSLKEMLVSLRVVWASEIAATTASTASKGLLSTALAFLRTGFSLAALSAKAFGIALLNAIPVIGQIIMIGGLAYAMLKDFFTTPPNALDKELENVQKRLEEFPKVIDQMANAYLVATGRVDKFVAAFKPLVGLTSQTDSQLQSLIAVQVAENLGKQINKTKELMAAEKKLADAKKVNKKAQEKKKTNFSPYSGLAESSEVRISVSEIAKLQEEVDKLKKAGIDTSATLDAARSTMIGYSASLRTAQSFLEEGSSEHSAYSDAIVKSDEVLRLLNEGSLKAAIKLHKENTAILRGELDVLNSVADATKKVDEFFLKAGQRTGFFSERIKLLSSGLNNLKPGKKISPEIITLYESLSQFEGITFPELKPGQILNEEQAATIRKQVKDLNDEMERLDKRARDLASISVAYDVSDLYSARTYGEGSAEAVETSLSNQQQILDTTTKLEQARLKLLKEGTDAYDTQALKVLKLVLAQKELNKSRVDAALGATGTAENRIGVTAASGALDEANTREKINIIQNMVSPMIEDLQKLGPEGELVASVAQGAFVISSAWSNVGQVFADNASSMEKGAAVAAAVGATFQQIGSIMSAQSNAQIAAIDKEIKAEQRRDGKSKESLARMQALESKKESQKRKAFESNKKVMMATTIANTAAAMMTALAPPPAGLGPVFGPALAGIAGAMGAAQLAIIAGTSYDGGGSAPSTAMPSKISVGNRNNTTDLAKSASPSGELAYARGQSGTGNMSNYTSAFTGYRAAGGNTAFMVGEQGPEMFVPDRPGTIVPADETAAGQTSPINVNFSINTIDARGVEDLLMTQQGNIIGMIRTAANAHGEEFLETVDDRALTMEK